MPQFFVDPDIAKASTINKTVYTSPEVFEEMKEKIFSKCWQFIGDINQVSENGSCYPFSLLENYLNEPLLLTKDESGELRCLSNVCTHRGNLLIYEPCKTSNLRCKYHGRLFHLSGKFKSMPEFKEVENFPSANDDLRELPLFQWSNWLFTSLDLKFPAQDFFKDMIARVEWMPLNDFHFRPDLSKEYVVDANWALYCENYLEGFHIPFIHAGLNALIDYGDYETELFFPFSCLQIGISKTGEDCFDLPPSSPDHGKNVAAYYFWIFPNMMFNFYPWGLSVNLVQPLAVGKTKVVFLSYVWKDEKRNNGAGGDLDKVELEDEEIVQKVQEGVRSRFYKHGRYSVTREKGTHHFHRLLAEFLNS
ncbi:MAG TPA: aromatic ring-hydroxylating dioxygenase subunit alpha [Chitinophagaceae bacterium]|nr:aromatic ring-hydroxylating dioxygenase subunit alpha [Chitinophagaceae bacterium]